MSLPITLPVVRPQPAFNGLPFSTIEIHGRQMYSSVEVGRALGYHDGGRGLSRLIRVEWADLLDEGDDYIILRGEPLKALNAIRVGFTNPDTGDTVTRRNRLLLLTEEGLYAVMGMTNRPAGKAFRRYVSRVLLPSVRNGAAAELPSPSDMEQLTRRLDEQERLVDRLTLAVTKAGIRLPPVKALPAPPALIPDRHATFARLTTWLRSDGAQYLYVVGTERAPRNCLGVLDGDHVYFVGACIAMALGLQPGTDTSEIARDWITAGLLDAHPNWDRHSMNSAKWPRYAPGVGSRKMFRARLDAPSCAG